MKTSELIAALAADSARGPGVARSLACAMLPAVGVAILAYALLLGPRPGLAETWTTARFLLKLGLSASLAVAAGGLLLRLASPGRSSGGWRVALVLVPVVLALAVVVEASVLPRVDWRAAWIGRNSTWCLRVIPALAAAPLLAAFLALRRAAPTRPVLTGAVAGLLSGALGASLYATHCPDDSPFFVVTWYGIAILCLAGLGAILGRSVLRW